MSEGREYKVVPITTPTTVSTPYVPGTGQTCTHQHTHSQNSYCRVGPGRNTVLRIDYNSSTPNSTGVRSGMSDGKNEARALRVLEIMNDFRTLQVHITSLVTRTGAQPTKAADQYLDGYVVLRQCSAAAQAILATHYNPGNLGIGDVGAIPETEVQKATLQRIILDASTRRFQAHKIYLRAAAAMRWVLLREQALGASPDKREAALSVIDGRLGQEITNITDEAVVTDLRNADRRKNYWLDEEPSLERMLAWIRRQG